MVTNNNNNNNNNSIVKFSVFSSGCLPINKNRKRREDCKGEDAKSGRTKLKRDNNNRMIEVIRRIKKEKPSGHS